MREIYISLFDFMRIKDEKKKYGIESYLETFISVPILLSKINTLFYSHMTNKIFKDNSPVCDIYITYKSEDKLHIHLGLKVKGL